MGDDARLAAARGNKPNGGGGGKRNSNLLPANPSQGLPNEREIWRGTTWPRQLLSWCCCQQQWWVITNRRIDFAHGCCRATEETIDLRRITDLTFERSCLQLMCCRGTLIVYASESSLKEYHISTWGMKRVYEDLREAWLASRQNVGVDASDGPMHH